MTILDDAVAKAKAAAELAHNWVNGRADELVQTENGPLRTLAKFLSDNQNLIDAIPPSLADKQSKTEKDKSNGYVGLAGWKIKVPNAMGNVFSTISCIASAVRDYQLRDQDGVIAFLSDITGDNSGTNTGDETKASLYEKLEITQLSGINTGDQTLESLGAQAKLTYVPADASTIGQAGGLVPLDSTAKIAAIYLPSFVDDVMEVDNYLMLPQPGERSKIYVATETNTTYRWSGSSYIELVSSPGTTDSVPEGAESLYFTEGRVLNTVLVGLPVVANTAISVTDNLITGLAKLQRQLTDVIISNNAKAPLVDVLLAGNARAPTISGADTTNAIATGFSTWAAISLAIASIDARMGVANGFAPLGSDTKIAAIYLPSFVDDVLEYATQAAFPATGEAGKIYVALNTNKTYRWGGSSYTEISPSPGSTDAVPEGASNLYFTSARAIAAVLTGFSTASSAVVSAADTILIAVGKLQAQLNALKAAPTFTGAINSTLTNVNDIYVTVASVDLSTDTITTTTNHNLVAGDYVLYSSTNVGMTVDTVANKVANFFVGVPAANKLTFHNTAAEAIAGTGKRDISLVGSGVETIAHASRAASFKTGVVNNSNALEVFSYRYSSGNTWLTVATRLQCKTDTVLQGYLEFNPQGNPGGLKYNVIPNARHDFSVDNVTYLSVRSGGVYATGDLQLNGVSVLTTSVVGAANGIAPLGADSRIAAIYLPSFVDDVLEYNTLANFPATGDTGKIYVALDTNRTYRWGGSAYTEISASPGTTDAVPEGASNRYFTDARVRAAVLTGLGAGTNVAIAAGDTILAAFAKLQNQITAVLAYVDLAILQTVHKGTARVVARTNLALTGLQTVDGVTLIAGDIILLTGQTAPAQNGPYVVAAGAWTRATNANTSAKMVLNATWHIREGSIYAGTTWFLATSAVTLDTTGLAITLVGQAIDWSTFIGGKPAAAATVLFAKATRPFSLPAALAGSQSEAGTAATASSVFTVYKNATSIGTITVSAAGTVGAFAAASKTDFAVGDKLKITAPGSQDGTLADISINLAGYLS